MRCFVVMCNSQISLPTLSSRARIRLLLTPGENCLERKSGKNERKRRWYRRQLMLTGNKESPDPTSKIEQLPYKNTSS